MWALFWAYNHQLPKAGRSKTTRVCYTAILGTPMAIRGVTRAQFEQTLPRLLTPTTPIRSIEFLRAATRSLKTFAARSYSPGAPSRSERQTCMQDKAHRGSVGPIW